MRAVQVREFGGPDVLEPVDLPEPVPGPGQLMLAMAVADVIYLDTMRRAGRVPAMASRLPYVPGRGGAGRVVAVGEGVGDGVAVDVAVGSGVAVAVAVGSGVFVGVGSGVSVGVGLGGAPAATILKPMASACATDGGTEPSNSQASEALFEANAQLSPLAAEAGTVAVIAPGMLNVLTLPGSGGENV